MNRMSVFIVLLLTAFMFRIDYSNAQNACLSREYNCQEAESLGPTCVHRRNLCNGRDDCPLHDDENVAICRDVCSSRRNRQFCVFNNKCQRLEDPCEDHCQSREFRCDTGVAPDACISLKYMCDGTAQCAGSEDEDPVVCEQFCNQSLGRFFCRARNKCLPLNQMCDGKKQCRGCQDELAINCMAINCTHGHVRCGANDAQCIKIRHICDYVTQCLNGWDEHSEQCPGNIIEPSLPPTIVPACIEDDDLDDIYSECEEEIEYGDYSNSNFHPSVSSVRMLLGMRLCEPAVFAHNYFRELHDDILPIRYDPQLSVTAEQQAMYLGDRLMNGEFGGHTTLNVGENIFLGFTVSDVTERYSMEDVSFSWYDEARQCQYDYELNQGRDANCITGHFEQVASVYTTRLGCGAAKTSYFGTNYLFVVCQYEMSRIPPQVTPLRDGMSYPDTFPIYEP